MWNNFNDWTVDWGWPGIHGWGGEGEEVAYDVFAMLKWHSREEKALLNLTDTNESPADDVTRCNWMERRMSRRKLGKSRGLYSWLRWQVKKHNITDWPFAKLNFLDRCDPGIKNNKLFSITTNFTGNLIFINYPKHLSLHCYPHKNDVSYQQIRAAASIYVMGQYWLMISASRCIGQAL